MTNVEFRACRLKAGITQAKVAIRGNADRTRLCMWEKGDLTLAPGVVQSLEKALGELIAEQADRAVNLLRESRQVSIPTPIAEQTATQGVGLAQLVAGVR